MRCLAVKARKTAKDRGKNLLILQIKYRTARLNEAVALIYSLDKGFSQNKNGQNESFFDLSTLVTPTIQFSKPFYSGFN
jgi:hypothetical protein